MAISWWQSNYGHHQHICYYYYYIHTNTYTLPFLRRLISYNNIIPQIFFSSCVLFVGSVLQLRRQCLNEFWTTIEALTTIKKSKKKRRRKYLLDQHLSWPWSFSPSAMRFAGVKSFDSFVSAEMATQTFIWFVCGEFRWQQKRLQHECEPKGQESEG